MRLDLLLLAAVCHATLQGAPELPRWTHWSSAHGDLPSPGPSDQQTGSLVADVNHDGVNDFFIAARVTGPAVTLFLRTIDGWSRQVVESDFLRVEAGGAAHDIDGDGDVDIVFGGDSGNNEVWWWENPYPQLDPKQRWRRHTIKASGGSKHHDQLFGDFDGDGEVELVAWNQRARNLLVFDIPSDPTSGEWPSRAIYSWSGEEHEGLAMADIDLDGQDDIVGGGRWFRHVGGGEFRPNLIDDRFRFSRAAAGQLVAGGRPEVVFAPGDVDGPMRWYEWTGDAWAGRDLPVPDLIHGHSIGVGDVNGDSHLDIFSAEMGRWGASAERSNPAARLRVFYGDSRGEFVEQVVAAGFGNHESRLADLDGDGDLDILAKPYNWKTPRVDVWRNESPGRPRLGLDRWERHVIDSAKPWRAVFVFPADLDGDRRPDIVTGGWWYSNPGSAGGPWRRRAFGEPLRNAACALDFDGDGDLDVLGTRGEGARADARFAWAENDGSGSFRIHLNLPRGDGDFLQGVAAGRFFAEHRRLSVALSWHAAGRGIQLLTVPQNPREARWEWSRVSEVSQDEAIDVADLDRDGDADVLLGTYWLANEDGDFRVRQLHPGAGRPDRNLSADIDGDGRLDAVSGYESSRSPGKLAWYRQPLVAAAQWQENLIDSVVGPMSLDVGDLDRDGDADLVVGQHNLADPDSSQLLVYANADGSGGTWTRHVIFEGDEHHDGSQLVDLDGDGDLDIVSVGWTHPRVLVYENLALVP